MVCSTSIFKGRDKAAMLYGVAKKALLLVDQQRDYFPGGIGRKD